MFLGMLVVSSLGNPQEPSGTSGNSTEFTSGNHVQPTETQNQLNQAETSWAVAVLFVGITHKKLVPQELSDVMLCVFVNGWRTRPGERGTVSYLFVHICFVFKVCLESG